MGTVPVRVEYKNFATEPKPSCKNTNETTPDLISSKVSSSHQIGTKLPNQPKKAVYYKITIVCLSDRLSACLSVRQFGVFLRIGSIVFSDFWYDAG